MFGVRCGSRLRHATRHHAGLHDQPGELHDAAIFFHHCRRELIDARRGGGTQSAQKLRAFFPCRAAGSREPALGGGDGAPRILLVGQRDVRDRLAIGRLDSVDDLTAVRFDECPSM